MALVGPNELATLFHLTPRRVQMLARDEGMPQAGRGKYDLLRCVEWYIGFLQKSLASRGPSSSDRDGMAEMRAAKLRQAQADAAMAEWEMEQTRGTLAPVADMAALWEDAVRRMRARVLASIGMAAVRCVGMTTVPQAHAVLEGVMHEALKELAKVGDEVAAGGTGDGDGVRARP